MNVKTRGLPRGSSSISTANEASSGIQDSTNTEIAVSRRKFRGVAARPPWPVAQNGQAMPQPAWLEMHRVLRSG
ncbi:hypothetical protein [Nocardia terpenica]|nr:hypothetical protein [Nocardia terpenica]